MPPITYLTCITNRLWLLRNSLTALSERRAVSKPQILSRLRYVSIMKRGDETEQERLYRIQYKNLQDWNNNYWNENNELFNREKELYIREHFNKEISNEEALSHDQLAHFYRTFLERNREKHVKYNRTMYKNHFTLLIRSINAKISRLRADVTTKR